MVLVSMIILIYKDIIIAGRRHFRYNIVEIVCVDLFVFEIDRRGLWIDILFVIKNMKKLTLMRI